jgi:hypothetical protein
MNVIIPNDVADAIVYYRELSATNAVIAKAALDTSLSGVNTLALRSIPFDTLIAALINGYEREQTAEERAHEDIRMEYVSCDWEYARGILFTLDTLGVKVAGVNT